MSFKDFLKHGKDSKYANIFLTLDKIWEDGIPKQEDITKMFPELAISLEIELLPEVHAHYSIQNKLSEHGFWIYDFILPYRILDTIITMAANELARSGKSISLV